MKTMTAGRLVVGLGAALFGLFLLVTDAGAQSSPNARRVADMTQGVSNVTCTNNPADGGSGAATCTLGLQAGTVFYTCSDGDGCTVTLAEPGAGATGRTMHVVNVSANAATFADSSGVSELAGSFVAGQWDSITLVYQGTRWVELGRSNN